MDYGNNPIFGIIWLFLFKWFKIEGKINACI